MDAREMEAEPITAALFFSKRLCRLSLLLSGWSCSVFPRIEREIPNIPYPIDTLCRYLFLLYGTPYLARGSLLSSGILLSSGGGGACRRVCAGECA